jgi:hypothetical protein
MRFANTDEFACSPRLARFAREVFALAEFVWVRVNSSRVSPAGSVGNEGERGRTREN